MTAREYLERLRTIDREINAMLDYKQDIIEMACRITSDMNPNKVQSGKQTSRIETAAIKLSDYSKEIDKKVDELVNLRREAECFINLLTDSRMRIILRYRYLNSWTWEKIAGDLNYDRMTIYRLHGYALLEFAKNMLHNVT